VDKTATTNGRKKFANLPQEIQAAMPVLESRSLSPSLTPTSQTLSLTPQKSPSSLPQPATTTTTAINNLEPPMNITPSTNPEIKKEFYLAPITTTTTTYTYPITPAATTILPSASSPFMKTEKNLFYLVPISTPRTVTCGSKPENNHDTAVKAAKPKNIWRELTRDEKGILRMMEVEDKGLKFSTRKKGKEKVRNKENKENVKIPGNVRMKMNMYEDLILVKEAHQGNLPAGKKTGKVYKTQQVPSGRKKRKAISAIKGKENDSSMDMEQKLRMNNHGLGISPIGKIKKKLKTEKSSKIGKLQLFFEGASHLQLNKVRNVEIKTNPTAFKEQLGRHFHQPIGTKKTGAAKPHSPVIGYAGNKQLE
jgi:hypothetical protein